MTSLADRLNADLDTRKGTLADRLNGSIIDKPPSAPEISPGPVFPEGEQIAKDRDDQLRALFTAGRLKDGDKRLGIIEMAKRRNIPVESLEQGMYEKLRDTATRADFDPRKWRRDNPALYQWLMEDRRRAPYALDVRKVGALAQFARESAAVMDTGLMNPLKPWFKRDESGKVQVDLPGGNTWSDAEPSDKAQYIDQMRSVWDEAGGDMERAEDLLRAKGIEPLLGFPGLTFSEKADAGTWEMIADTWDKGRLGSKRSKLYQRLHAIDMQSYLAGEESEEAKDEIYEIQKELIEIDSMMGVQKDYGQNAAQQLAMDTTQAMSSMLDTFVAQGVAGGVAGAATTVVTKNPAAGSTVGTIAGRVASSWTSYVLESGSLYAELRDATDDQGRPIDRDVAIAASAVGGMIKAGIEVVTLGEERALGLASSAFLRKSVKSASGQALWKRLGKSMLSSGVSEMTEESLQALTDVVTEWAAKSQHEWQELDVGEAAEEIVESGVLGFIGGVAMVPIAAPVRIAMQGVRQSADRKAVKMVPAIMRMGEASKEAPGEIARYIAIETKRQGREVTHIYIDPSRLTDAIKAQGGDPDALAVELLGENGPSRIREAMMEQGGNHGATLEVSVEEALEKWADHPISKILFQDMTTKNGGMTAREDVEQQEQLEALAVRLAKDEVETAEDLPGPNEEGFIESVEEQLSRASGMTPKEIKVAVAQNRAFIRTMAKRMGENAENLFANWSVRIRGEGEFAVSELEAAQEQEADPADEARAEEKPRRTMTVAGRRRRKSRETIKTLVEENPAFVAEKISKPQTQESESLADVVVDRVISAPEPRQPRKISNRRKAWETVVRASFPDGGSPTAVEDSRYQDALEGRGDMPREFPGGTFDAINEFFELKGRQRVRSAQHAFNILMHRGEGSLARRAEFAVEFMRENVPGFETMRLPADLIDALAEEDLQREIAELETEYYAEISEADVSFDPDALEAEPAAEPEVAEVEESITPQQEMAQRAEVRAKRGNVKIGDGEFILPNGMQVRRANDADTGKVIGWDVFVGNEWHDRFKTKKEAVAAGLQIDINEVATEDANAIRELLEKHYPESFMEKLLKPKKFLQEDDDGPRGWVKVNREGVRTTFEIFLTKRADLSTYLHESAHVYLEMLRDMAENGGPASVQQDFGDVAAHLGIKDRNNIGREAHEKWANSFEAYLLNGEAPSVQLAGAFATYRYWLKEVYRTVRGLVGAPRIDPKLRQVFDRMLATDAELRRVRLAAGLDQPMWRSHQEAGMTPAQWQSYLKIIKDSTANQILSAQRQIAKARLKAAEAFRSSEFKKLRQEAEADYLKRRDVQALRFARLGEMIMADGRVEKFPDAGKLDRKAVRDMVGDVLEGKIPKNRMKKGGVHPDEMAAQLGFPSGESMLMSMASVPDIKEYSQRVAEQRIKEKHPELDVDIATFRKRLEEVAHNRMSGDWMIKEFAAINRKVDRRKDSERAGRLAYRAAEQAAAVIVGNKSAGRLDLGQTLNRERKAANDAAVEAAKGNFRRARELKLQQMLQHHLWRQLNQATKDRDSFLKISEKMLGKNRRQVMGKAGRDFVNASDLILQALGFGGTPHESASDVGSHLAAIERVYDIEFPNGGNVARLMRDPPQSWKMMSIEQMREVRSVLSMLYKQALNENAIIVEGQRVQIEDLIASIARETEDRRSIEPGDPKKNYLRNMFASLTEPQEVLRRLGKSAYQTFWVDGYLAGERKSERLLNEVGQHISEAWAAMPKEMQARANEIVEDPNGAVRFPVGMDRVLNRQAMWMIALNMGNESNRDRLLGGYRWNQGDVMTWLQENLTQEEGAFINSVWSLMDDKLFPEIQKTYEEATGLPPPKIEATPIQMPWGQLNGGYIPAKYDPIHAETPAGQVQEASEQGAMMGHGFIGASIQKGFVKERSEGFSDVINLDWSIIPNHVFNVIHYVSFDRFVRQSNAIMKRKEFADLAREKVGKDHYDNLYAPGVEASFVQAVALAGRTHRDNLRAVGRLMDWGRAALVANGIGWSLKTAMADYVDPLSTLIANKEMRISPLHLGMSYVKSFPLNPQLWLSTRKRALEKSAEVRHRAENIKRRVREDYDAIDVQKMKGAGWKLLAAVQESAFFFLDTADKLSSTTIWTAAYDQAIARGQAEADAVAHADKVLSFSMPTQDPLRKAPLLKDRKGFAQFVVFYGYLGRKFNQSTAVMDEALSGLDTSLIAGAGKFAARVGQMMALVGIGNVIGELIAGRGKEEDEEWAEWFMRKSIAGPLLTVPVAGQFGEAAVNWGVSYTYSGEAKSRKFNERAAPAFDAIERISKKIGDVLVPEDGEEQQLWDALEVIGTILRLPTGSAAGRRVQQAITEPLSGDAQDVIYGTREDRPESVISVFSP